MSDESTPAETSLDRIKQLVSDLEQALATMPDDSPRIQALKDELYRLRALLGDSDAEPHRLKQHLEGAQNALDDLVASVEGEILRDTPYLTEMARILGLV